MTRRRRVPLGSVTAALQWPDGEVGPSMEVRADRFVTNTRGAAEPVRWEPKDQP